MTPAERRAQAAERLQKAMFDCWDDVRQDGDRVTARSPDGDYVTVIVTDARPAVPDDAVACPFCGSSNLKTFDEESKHWHSRRGCLDCEQWLDPVRRRR